MRSKNHALLFAFIGVVIASILLSAAMVQAQDGGDDGDEEDESTAIPISYGQTLEGEISNNVYEVFYTFTGSAGDVIIIEMRPIEIIESALITVEQFDSPRLEVLDSNNEILAQTTRYDRADVALQLPEDGDYMIKATREDGEIGISTGEFSIALIEPLALELGDEIVGTLLSNERNYYIIRDADSFTLQYERISGDFSPEVAVLVMVEDELFNDLNTFGYIAALNGTQLESGTLTIDGEDNANGVYIVLIHQALFDFRFQENPDDSDYGLTLIE